MKRKLFAWMMAISFAFTNVNSFAFAEEGAEEPAATEETSQEETIETETLEQTETTEETVQDNEPEQTDTAEEAGQEEKNDGESIPEAALSDDSEEISENSVEEDDAYFAGETSPDNFEYKFTSDGQQIIITKIKTSPTNVVIPSTIKGYPVVAIGDRAFNMHSGIRSIVVPDGVTSIGAYAFSGCTHLSNITIPESVTSIGSYAFQNCNEITTAGPTGSGADYEFGWTESIPDNAFSQCMGITKITIPDSITKIGKESFENCKKLIELTIPEGVISIGTSAFCNCISLMDINIPSGITKIDDTVFSGCESLNNISIPENVTSIGNYAFQNCRSINSIMIPDSVTNIGEGVFENCERLSNICIPASVNSLGKYLFSGCGIKTAGPIGSGADYEFGWTTYIPDNAFHSCDSLISIQLPDGITSIGCGAFCDCIILPEITLPVSVQIIGDYAFERCWKLDNISFTNSVKKIGINAFDNCTNLIEVYYYGRETEWKSMDIQDGNILLKKAKIIYKYSAPTSITVIEGKYIEIPTGSRKTISVEANPYNSDDRIIWTSSSEKIGDVDSQGTVSAYTYGNTTITATSIADPKIKATITVQTRFYDVNDSTQSYYKPVYWGADNGVVAGYDGGVYFGPDNVCTRAQFVTFLWRLAGKPEGKKSVNFKDISTSVNYYRAVKWAVSEGIIVGYKDDNTFRPDNEVTRGQVATMLWRFAGKKTPTLPKTSPFSDVSTSSNTYRAIVWGQKAGVIKGYKDGTFQPDASCLRQHIVTFLYRYARDVMGKKVN